MIACITEMVSIWDLVCVYSKRNSYQFAVRVSDRHTRRWRNLCGCRIQECYRRTNTASCRRIETIVRGSPELRKWMSNQMFEMKMFDDTYLTLLKCKTSIGRISMILSARPEHPWLVEFYQVRLRSSDTRPGTSNQYSQDGRYIVLC